MTNDLCLVSHESPRQRNESTTTANHGERTPHPSSHKKVLRPCNINPNQQNVKRSTSRSVALVDSVRNSQGNHDPMSPRQNSTSTLSTSKLNPNATIFVPRGVRGTNLEIESNARLAIARSLCCWSSKQYQEISDNLARQKEDTKQPLATRPRTKACDEKPLAAYTPNANLGPKITAVDAALKIFVVDLFSEAECDWILQTAADHDKKARANNGKTWRKLYTYTDHDLPCGDVPALRKTIKHMITKVLGIVKQILMNPRHASKLALRSEREPHLLRYQQNESDPKSQTEMAMHYDGCHLTWQLMLNAHGVDYRGGGTYFSSLRKTVLLKKGQVLLHPGNLYHRGVAITSGVRTLLVCFMDGFDLKVKDQSDWKEDASDFEKNVASF